MAKIEPNIACNLPRYQRSLFAQLRFGILPISIETGRAQKKTVEERVCTLCSDGVEHETHFICICEYHKFQRDELFNKNNYTEMPGMVTPGKSFCLEW